MTMNKHGRMKSTSGIMMRTGTCCAFSSARCRRFTLISFDWMRNTRATGMPNASAWTIAEQNDLRSRRVVRSAIDRIAAVRPIPICISWSNLANS